MLDKFLASKKELLQNQKTIYIGLKVTTNSAKTYIKDLAPSAGDAEPKLKFCVKEKPEKGRANKAIEKFFSSFFDGQCKVVSGMTEPTKLIQIKK